MTDTRPGAETCTLWGGALSLYTGKVRSYLIKKGVPYREFYASHPDFLARIRPVVGLGVTPVLETPGGDILQDSTEIIEAMERRLPGRPMIPATPVLRALAWLLDAYGSEHLLAMAMHFRWAEPHISLQRSFLQAEFGRAGHAGDAQVARVAQQRDLVDVDGKRHAGGRSVEMCSTHRLWMSSIIWRVRKAPTPQW